MKITLTQFKHRPARSIENECFEAIVCFDGNPALVVANNGKAGPDRFRSLPGQGPDELRDNLLLLKADLKTRKGGLMSDGTKGPSDLLDFIAVLVDVEIRTRSCRRKLKSSILYTFSNSLRLFSVNVTPCKDLYDFLRITYKNAVILNELPFDEALDHYLDRVLVK